MKRLIFYLAIVIFASITTAWAQQSPVFAPGGQALRGYDPVAYFIDGKPVPGDSTISYAYQGATWYFASAKNRDMFKADPEKYAPQYGGYCAYGTSQGHKAPTEPDAWTIDNGKLYFNYNKKVQTLWNKDRAGHIQKADTNWPLLKDKDSH
ncbi:YHS domain-containing (seleno)protein [Spirosoma aerolatum]|uniref:YHS domain-containing (seleno)protein n=1 Tax=Spirosoma aerolatum TaxID=1211326 RepID=UPI0009ACF6DF|nr:YHS domain-containing (seleno)protein [Spirosoma aerolatum]